jgi:hypothetical protein
MGADKQMGGEVYLLIRCLSAAAIDALVYELTEEEIAVIERR